MSDQPNETTALVPRAEIRRFDIFAEYNRLKNERKGLSPDEAKGEALWLAKLVAARKFARTAEARDRVTDRLRHGKETLTGERSETERPSYHELGGEPQTGALFDREIVERMGERFYQDVLSPAVAEAVARGESYEAIRDRLRAPLNRRRVNGRQPAA